jgi:pimeloyl-ACP methyl ester carboxylesterase
MANANITVLTSQGPVSVWASSGGVLPLILLHGNSMSKAVFSKQMASPLAGHYRLIAIDLPGHGDSADASDPVSAYTLPGYATAVREVLDVLAIPQAVLFGWSLGGHVALELATRWPGAVGVGLSGAPPATATPAGLRAAFIPNAVLALLGREEIDGAESLILARGLFGASFPAFALRDIRRTDGRARRILFESLLAGQAMDARSWVANRPLPIAIIDGSDDPLVHQDYVSAIEFAALWEGVIHRIDGTGHAPFWQKPRLFNQILHRFMRDMTCRANPDLLGQSACDGRLPQAAGHVA